MILIGTVGKILSGDSAGWYVKVLDDSHDSSGFLILTSIESDFSTGFDNWVENKEKLECFFAESGWQIEWQ